ncbi:Arc family DNA-binding protein [Acetobacter senegalensis]|uniref:Arc family DNA-binding protein n=1 Tax=Acetobacter senegalensis TaxID=446692 RepID=UPI001EDC8770|nr:Arc family DNA-binding protein [Acetobacter senegalensis]MCG4258203.1 Arc family DNA-binding protein [Acetobacter senegalensis]MCG4268130.1 Arc family DNA-binding protein [Acetobacter senegalensis]
MSRTDPQMKIRVPPDLKDWIDRKAKDEQRTKNAQIVRILTRAMIEDGIRKEGKC